MENEILETHLSSIIQAEQIKLVNIEKILEQLLTKINENINTLTVEELQLRSSAIQEEFKTKLEYIDPIGDVLKQEYDVLDTTDQINKQNICLNIFGNPMDAEYDSD